MTMKSLTTSDTIRTSLQRPKVSFNIELNSQEEDMGSLKDIDPLPIVELKPFVQKVWRREKSFAGTWERSPSVATVKSEKSETTVSKTKETETISTLTLESGLEDISISPPPRTSHSLPSRLTERFLTVYVSAFDDFKSQKEHIHRFVGESGYKAKNQNRLHPVVDPKNKKQPEHCVNIIPGFITRDDRTKTTLNEISEGDSTSRFYSFSPKAIGPDDIRKQQQLRVSGEKMDQFRRASPQNYSPTPSRIMNGSWHGASVRHGSPASMLYHNKKDNKVKRMKTPLYDHLDRTGSLPSLSIHSSSLKQRGSQKLSDANSEDYVDYTDSYDVELKHKIGGIENSLIVLSKHGAPTKVERQISFELENNLSRFRKLKDYSPFEINPSELAKYYPPPSFNMTQGEARIRQAMLSNTPKQKQRKLKANRHVHGKSVGFTKFNDMHNNHFIHGILKNPYNEIEHIDSFDSLYGPYNRANTNEFTPNDEPNVPFDTPRSRVESRISAKVNDTTARDTKAKTGSKDIGLVVTKNVQSVGTKDNQVTGTKYIQSLGTEAIQSTGICNNQTRKESQSTESKDIQSAGTKTIQSELKIVAESETQTSLVKRSEPDKEHKDMNTIEKVSDVNINANEPELRNDTNETNVKPVQMKSTQPQTNQTDASGRTFLTSDALPQMGIVSS